jgi:hypothetical protein
MKICKICGEREEDHHEPDWIEVPDGCVCHPKTWNYETMKQIPPACDNYMGDGNRHCAVCEHDKECHKVEKDEVPKSR